jgi:hypothetical protein
MSCDGPGWRHLQWAAPVLVTVTDRKYVGVNSCPIDRLNNITY